LKAHLACQLLQAASTAIRPGFLGELFSHFVRDAPHELHGSGALLPVHRLCNREDGVLHQLIACHPVDEYRVGKEGVDRTSTIPPPHTFNSAGCDTQLQTRA
jgi:hypothetical protein